MNKQVLSPFDGDLLAMIADITKVEPKVTENDNKFIVDVQLELTIPGETMEALGKAVAGRLGDRPEKDFKREFEPKNNPVENTQKEPANKGCGDCANFTNEGVNGNGYCEAFKSEQSCGTWRCQEYKPKN